MKCEILIDTIFIHPSDFLSIFPVIQQVVGGGTIFSNTFKALFDLIAHIEAKAIKFFREEKKNWWERQRSEVSNITSMTYRKDIEKLVTNFFIEI